MQTEEIIAAVPTEPLAENSTTTGIENNAGIEELPRDCAEVSRSLAAPEGEEPENSAPQNDARRRAPNKVSVTSDPAQPPAGSGAAISPGGVSPVPSANPPPAGGELKDNARQAPLALRCGSATILDLTMEPASAEAPQNAAPTNVQPDPPAEEVGLEITIDPEFQKLCPPLSEEAHQLLKAGIERDGQLAALSIWKNNGLNILVDGHHRYSILESLGREVRTVEVRLENRGDAVDWAITNQLGRRNLCPSASKLLRGLLYNAKKGRHGGPRQASAQSDHMDSVAAQIGKETGVSPATVRRDARLAAAAEKLGVTEKIMAGTEKRSAKELVATAFSAEAGNVASVSLAIPRKAKEAESGSDTEALKEGGPYRSSAIYKHVQAVVKAIGRIPWGDVDPAVAKSARRDIEAAFPEAVFPGEKPAAESRPAFEKPRTKRSKKGQTQPGQTEFGFAVERHASC